MATEKIESNVEVVVELTKEQHLLIAALESDDVIGNLSVLKDDEGTTEKLSQLITVYIALQGALGDDAGATINAHQNLVNYQPAKVKKPKEPKVPKFNESKALKDALESDELDILVQDERISDDLKNAIITYTTLRDLGTLPEEIVDAAKETLARFGKKTGSRSTSGPKEIYNVEVNGITYANRTEAVKAQGYGEELIKIGDKEHRAVDVVWRKISAQFVKNDVAIYDNITYTKVTPVVA